MFAFGYDIEFSELGSLSFLPYEVRVLDGVGLPVVCKRHALIMRVHRIRWIFRPELLTRFRTYVVKPEQHYDVPPPFRHFERLLDYRLRYGERRVRYYEVELRYGSFF